MYNWERRAAENLTNTERVLESHFWKRERERAEVKREMLRMRTPSPPSSSSSSSSSPPQSNNFKTRTYNRPWAQGEAAAKRFSKTRGSWKGSVSYLPAISSGAQSKTTKPPHRGKTPQTSNSFPPLPFQCNQEHPAKYPNTHRSADGKGRVLQVSTHGNTNIQAQSRDILKGKNKVKHLCDRANISTRNDPVYRSTLERHSPPPHLISSPGGSYTHWPRMLTLCRRSPSPEDEPALRQMSDHFEGFSEVSGIAEELPGVSREDAYTEGFSTVSDYTTVVESVDSDSSAGSLEDPLSDSTIIPLSSLLSGLVLPSESDEDEADYDFTASWQDSEIDRYYIPSRWTGSQSSSASSSPSHHAGVLQSLGSGIASLNSDGYSLMPPLVQTGRPRIAPPSPVAGGVNRGVVDSPQRIGRHLPQTSWLTSPPRPLRADVDQEATSSDGNDDMLPSSGEVSSPRTFGQMDRLTSELMFHEIHVLQAEERGAAVAQEAQSVTGSNFETICGIRERLLLEESSDEEGDQCRICHSGARSLNNPLLTPCQCSGSLQFIHHDCLKKWIQTKVLSGSELSVVKTCELCKGSLTVALDNFDLDDYYQRHGQQQQADDVNADLYMWLQLHQMFLDLLQVTLSHSDRVSRILSQPIRPHTPRTRGSRAGQRSNPSP